MRHARPTPGFTLIEIAVVIVVLSLLLAIMAGIATAIIGQQRREVTRQKLAGVETAIALFVSQFKRLPCPADGTLPAADPNDTTIGFEKRTGQSCDNSQTNGVVPWRTLGLSEPDITDGWNTRMTYRVAPSLVADSAMDLTNCDPGGTFDLNGTPSGRCNQAGTGATDCNKDTFPTRCTPPSAYTYQKGILIRDAKVIPPATHGVIIMDPCAIVSTGAAYVVISHGENREGGRGSSGILQDASGEASGAEEQQNFTKFAFNPSACPTYGQYFVDGFPIGGPGHFDDFVLRPAILTVATKAQLAPRAH